MKNQIQFIALILITTIFIFSSCTTEDKCAEVTCDNGQICIEGVCLGSSSNLVVSQNITTDQTWTNDNIYELSGRISVESGATLTIEAGTIIKGQAGSGPNATALVIARGGKIMAEGTATAPIIFTTVADEIDIDQVASGDFASPNLAPTVNGQWGGLMILGNAPISATVNPAQIEGIPTTDENGLYGGSDAADNSGVIRYVSIRHGGANIGNGNEINGLTLGGVGNGTTIENIEIIGNQDDGIEFFGGSVDVSNLLIMNVGDDAVDTDQEWTGTLNNFIVIQGAESDHALELDGGEGSVNDVTFSLTNGSCKGYYNTADSTGGEYADLRSKVQCSLENVYFFNFGKNADLELDNVIISDNYKSSKVSFTGLKFNTTHLTSGNLTTAQILVDKSTAADAFDNLTTVQADNATTIVGGANKTNFANWTWTSQANLLSDF